MPHGRRGITRRGFLRTAAASAGLPYVITSMALGGGGHPAASGRIAFGIIGLGFGWPMFLRNGVRYVAVCDVRQERRDAAKALVDSQQGGNGCAAHRDFREVLARDDVDAVYIATPDHWHALVTIAAARAGRHVYCQKPLTRTIAEGRAVVDAVRRHGIVFQHGTQQRQDSQMLFGCELVRNGYIGELRRVKIGSPAGATCPPQMPEPVPPGLDWEMWLGPAPWAPFTPLRIQAHPWYHISDYCMGYIAGWGVHHADSAMQGSGLDSYHEPIEIDARGVFPQDGLFDNPYQWRMQYRFANGVAWDWKHSEGGWDTPAGYENDPRWDERNPTYPMGIRFEGTNGWVYIWRGFVDARPRSLLRASIGPSASVHLVQPGGQPIPDFLDCVRNRLRTCAPVEVAHRSTTLCSIGAIGMRVGRRLVWDPVREEFLGDEGANRFRARAPREPWCC